MLHHNHGDPFLLQHPHQPLHQPIHQPLPSPIDPLQPRYLIKPEGISLDFKFEIFKKRSGKKDLNQCELDNLKKPDP